MKGHLHCPHDKAYCVEYQTSLGTLKGIENSWHEVPAGGSCQWENQQHGKGHHCKIVLESGSIPQGSEFELILVHEDGTRAPDATLTKHGKRKSTMLVGVDPRDSRLGLSWGSVDQEGPRKWFPASNCKIHLSGANTPTMFAKNPEDNSITLYVPCGKPIVIPIRIEVLSAVKGAGDFSRYCVSCEFTDETQKELNWKSPCILVEAKWLPAAPVREQNKRRFNRIGDYEPETHTHTETHAPTDPFALLQSSKSFIENAIKSFHQLHNPRHKVLDYGHLDDLLEQLKVVINQYQYQRFDLHGVMKNSQVMMNDSTLAHEHKQKRREKHHLVYRNWSTQQQQQLLSSPPRNKRVSGLTPIPPLDLNNCSSSRQSNNSHPTLRPFDLLATAASSKHQIPSSTNDPSPSKRQRTID